MISTRTLCIHGHFYQPPREDPWLGRILIEPSAAPMRHWNERITRESYAPLAWARRMGGDGTITDIVNCYEWISFNVGPTLMRWLERRDPETYSRILAADAVSKARWGHGNAMAQVYHHVIMPLASQRDRELECAWAMADFRARFGREAEGMWLSECAADLASLETLAAAGIRFVTLAPRQAAAIVTVDGRREGVDEGSLDIRTPYFVRLPSGKRMAVFFYHGGLSQAIAFEGLLRDGEKFWSRIRDTAFSSQSDTNELLTLSTDGETYGHHFHFGEMALSYVLSQGYSGRDGLRLTNFGAFLEANPPQREVILHEPSSWSCVHGVERWRSNCGCTDGGHPEWNQNWRQPLRNALDAARAHLDAHFFAAARTLCADPEAALRDYGMVLAQPDRAPEFLKKHAAPGADSPERRDALWKLLAMQEQALAAFASCAWFFDDISRLEPVNAMTFMWRALELAQQTGFSGAEAAKRQFEAMLAEAQSNKPDEGSGADILRARVFPKRQDAASLTLMALLALEREGKLPESGKEAEYAWPDAAVCVRLDGEPENAASRDMFTGTATIRTALEQTGYSVRWEWQPPLRPGRAADGMVPPLLAESRITVHPENGETLTRNVRELPRHVRAYNALRETSAMTAAAKSARIASARNALSLLDTWEEGQSGKPYPWDWAETAPYLAFVCITDDSLSDAQRRAAMDFLRTLATGEAMAKKAGLLLQDAMLAALESGDNNARLQDWVHRACQLLPSMDWWPVQNALWKKGIAAEGNRDLARSLGFRSA